MPTSRLDRRTFLKTSAAAISAPAILTCQTGVAAKVAPNERISVGVIGLGSRGFNLVDDLLNSKDAEIVALCDVDSFHYRDRPWGQGKAYGTKAAQQYIEQKTDKRTKLFTTGDFREICGRSDIDAIVIATPDHWHALCTLTALRSGKDVYCEKPLTHTFQEGQLVYRECAKQNAIFQTGSQQRSDRLFRRAVELVRNGHLGEVRQVEVGLPPGYAEPQDSTEVLKVPDHLDYDFWCGPSPVLPYMRARHHRWWRGHRAYGGGVLMDWIGHHNDIAHWGLDLDHSGPTMVTAANWTFPDTDVYNTPHQYEILCQYANGATNSISSRNKMGTKFIGENGWVHVTRGKLDASDPRWAKADFDPGSKKVYASDAHMQNFLDGVRSRDACICPAETAHRSITPGHLGYVSQALNRPLNWDPAKEVVVNDDEANQLLQALSYRSPWKP